MEDFYNDEALDGGSGKEMDYIWMECPELPPEPGGKHIPYLEMQNVVIS
jgi:hypothetical protein